MNETCRKTVDEALASIGDGFGFIAEDQKYAASGCDSGAAYDFYEKAILLNFDDLLMICRDGKFPYNYDPNGDLIREVKEIFRTCLDAEVIRCLLEIMRRSGLPCDDESRGRSLEQVLNICHGKIADENELARIFHRAERQAQLKMAHDDNFSWSVRVGIASDTAKNQGFLYVKYDVRMKTPDARQVKRFTSRLFDLDDAYAVRFELGEMKAALGIEE